MEGATKQSQNVQVPSFRGFLFVPSFLLSVSRRYLPIFSLTYIFRRYSTKQNGKGPKGGRWRLLRKIRRFGVVVVMYKCGVCRVIPAISCPVNSPAASLLLLGVCLFRPQFKRMRGLAESDGLLGQLGEHPRGLECQKCQKGGAGGRSRKDASGVSTYCNKFEGWSLALAEVSALSTVKPEGR